MENAPFNVPLLRTVTECPTQTNEQSILIDINEMPEDFRAGHARQYTKLAMLTSEPILQLRESDGGRKNKRNSN
jgi:hypothetical protein